MKESKRSLLLCAAAIAFSILLYFIVNATFTKTTYLVMGLIVIGLIIISIQVYNSAKKQHQAKKDLYGHNYGEFIGTAFSHKASAERQLYKAIEDYCFGRPKAGLERLEKLTKKCATREDKYVVAVFEALCYEMMGSLKEAVEKYDDAIHIHPNSILASNKGLCCERLGETEKAAKSYEHAIRLDPSNPLPRVNLALHCLRLGEVEKAGLCAEDVLKIAPNQPRALTVLAMCSYMQGDTAAYEDYAKKAEEAGVPAAQLTAEAMAKNAEQIAAMQNKE